MKNDKQRLFEVMGRLDKTFKPNLNEGFEEIEATDDVEVPAEIGAEEIGVEVPAEEPVEEKSPEEKLAELTAKVDELYAIIHDEAAEEVPAEPEAGEEEISIETLEEEKKEDEEEKVEVEVEVNEAEVPIVPIAKENK